MRTEDRRQRAARAGNERVRDPARTPWASHRDGEHRIEGRAAGKPRGRRGIQPPPATQCGQSHRETAGLKRDSQKKDCCPKTAKDPRRPQKRAGRGSVGRGLRTTFCPTHTHGSAVSPAGFPRCGLQGRGAPRSQAPCPCPRPCHLPSHPTPGAKGLCKLAVPVPVPVPFQVEPRQRHACFSQAVSTLPLCPRVSMCGWVTLSAQRGDNSQPPSRSVQRLLAQQLAWSAWLLSMFTHVPPALP